MLSALHKKTLLPQGQEGWFVEDEFCAINLEAGWTRGPRLAVSVDLLGRTPTGCGRSGSCRIRSRIAQAILHQVDLHASAGGAMHLAIPCGQRCIAHADGVDAVYRDVMVQHQVTDYHLRHVARTGDSGAAVAGSEALYFQDVSLLGLQRFGHLIESSLGVLAQNGLAGTEADLSLRNRRVLIEPAHRLLHAGDLGGGSLG